MEHGLFREAEGVVTTAVELLVRQAAEVADTRKCERQKTVEELPSAVAAKRHVGANRLTLAQLELSDRLAGVRHLGLLASDGREVLDGAVDDFAIAGSLTNTRVDDDLHESGHLVHVREAEVLLELLGNLRAVLLLEARLSFDSRRGSFGVRHYRSSPDFLA